MGYFICRQRYQLKALSSIQTAAVWTISRSVSRFARKYLATRYNRFALGFGGLRCCLRSLRMMSYLSSALSSLVLVDALCLPASLVCFLQIVPLFEWEGSPRLPLHRPWGSFRFRLPFVKARPYAMWSRPCVEKALALCLLGQWPSCLHQAYLAPP